MLVRKTHRIVVAAAALAGAAGIIPAASAAVVPFTETFENDSANWYNFNATAPLQWLSDGGPGGAGDGFARGQFNFVNSVLDDTPVILRGQDNLDSSNDAFVGNWITDGVTEYTMYVRHDAPLPLNFFTRFSTLANFPGAVAVGFVPAMPNTWTPITFAIDPSNPAFISYENSDFETIFSQIGNVQIGVSVPDGLAGLDQSFTFDVDNVSIIPAPAAWLLLGMAGVVGRRRRR